MPDQRLLSVVVPVFNEAPYVEQLLFRIFSRGGAGLDPLGVAIEVVIVDDGSTDGSREILDQIVDPRVRIVRQGHNRGKGAALREGFRHVRGDWVLIQDADLEYDPGDYAALLAPLLEGRADVVYGSRFLYNRVSVQGPLNRFANVVLTELTNRVTGTRLTDMETCYKVLGADLVRELLPALTEERFGFEPEITARLARRGVRFAEVPVSYRPRTWREGKKIRARDAVRAIYCILRYSR